MTKYVVASDMHGNAPSMSHLLDQEGKDANYLFLGDMVGLNGYPNEVLSMCREYGAVSLIGNHDYAVLLQGEGHVNNEALSRFEVEHTLASVTEGNCKWVEGLSSFEVHQDSHARMALAHAYPWPENSLGYEMGNAGVHKGHVTSVAASVSDDYDWVFLGHTHHQYDLDCSRFGHDVHFVNPGTLGYDGTYSVVDTKSGEVEHKSVEWDHDALKRAIQSKLPEDAPHVEDWL